MSDNTNRNADAFYAASTPKPKAAVDADGWRALPNGGWVRDSRETGGRSGLVYGRPASQRPADIFYEGKNS